MSCNQTEQDRYVHSEQDRYARSERNGRKGIWDLNRKCSDITMPGTLREQFFQCYITRGEMLAPKQVIGHHTALSMARFHIAPMMDISVHRVWSKQI